MRRQLLNRGPDRLVVLALGGAGEHAGRDGEAFAAWEDEHGMPPQQLPLPEDLSPGERAAPRNAPTTDPHVAARVCLFRPLT